jgi:phospholipid/cholesterol/gamma-HCH transport system ATP-binding protein
VVISHDMASTFRIGHTVSMLYKGRIIASGTPDEILRNANPDLREFISTSRAVELPPLDGAPGQESP